MDLSPVDKSYNTTDSKLVISYYARKLYPWMLSCSAHHFCIDFDYGGFEIIKIEISILSDAYFGYSDVAGGCWKRKSSVMLDVGDGFAILIINIHYLKKSD